MVALDMNSPRPNDSQQERETTIPSQTTFETLSGHTQRKPSFQRITDRSSSRILILIILIALPLRIYWMATQTPVMNMEGSEYVRMAENLAGGQGLVGNFPGPETMYSPLFAVMTAGLDLLVRNPELAAHLISLALGVALVVPVYLIGQMMYGKRVAGIAALIVAIHPFLIKLSASIYNEDVYLFLLMLGIYWGLRCLESGRIRDCVFLSLCFGLAYLARPEALAYSFFFALAVWLIACFTGRAGWRPAAGSGVIVGVSLLIALPYAWFLYAHTGHVRLEGKWDINYTMANRIESGMEEYQAAYGLDHNNRIAGPLLDPFHFAAYSPYPQSLHDKAKTLLAMAIRHHKLIYQLSGGSWIGLADPAVSCHHRTLPQTLEPPAPAAGDGASGYICFDSLSARDSDHALLPICLASHPH